MLKIDDSVPLSLEETEAYANGFHVGKRKHMEYSTCRERGTKKKM